MHHPGFGKKDRKGEKRVFIILVADSMGGIYCVFGAWFYYWVVSPAPEIWNTCGMEEKNEKEENSS